VEFNHKLEESIEKSPFSKYFNSQSLSTLKSPDPNNAKLTLPSLTITFSHLYKEISHSIFFLKFPGYSI